MTATSQSTLDTATDGTGSELSCAVCNHPLADHDRISRRYCDATQVQALTRNCICPK